jgi:hypothetical protein
MHKNKQIEIIELSATVAAAATDTRVSGIIPYAFKIKQIEIHSTGTLGANFTLRYGVSKGGTEAIASDPTFRDLRSNRSSKENQRYPDSTIRLFPGFIIPQPEYRFKAEAINSLSSVQDYMIIFVIEELGEEYGN